MSDPFTIGGFTYRAGRLDAIRQLHVVRRLGPLIGALQGTDLAGALGGAATDEDKAKQGDAMMGLIGPLTEALAAISDADTEYVLGACLSVVQREQPGGLGWSQVWNNQAKRPMYDDIGLSALIQICMKVLMQNVGDFTSALPQLG